MTTYNLSADIRNGNVSQTQNVGTFDTVSLSLTFAYGITVQSQSNIGSVSLGTGGGSQTSTTTVTIEFFAAGSYSIVLHQSYFNRTYTLTATASGSTNYGYGLHVYDANGNIRMDMSRRQPRIVGFVSGTGNGSSFNRSFTGYNGSSSDNRGDEWYALSLEPNSNYYVNDTGAFGSFTIERADVRTSNASFQVLGGSEDYRMVIIRM